ncbi:MAG: methylated-DNA--[protein]-cysteine S-methyltransferase [Thermoguttaceae bacterium]|jgi:methylated-DNA-[protein]-cysteine S-methyltransferase
MMSTVVTFPSVLGWFALVGQGRVLKGLTFGHPSSETAIKALGPNLLEEASFGQWNPMLVKRLQSYAQGKPVDFSDVEVDLGPQTDFRSRVIRYCRQIPFGRTLTYAQLAVKADCPGAARAVGNCMACNRIPLVIPCHRVLASGGGLGGYSAPGGISLKRQLLELEHAKI